LNRSPDPHRRRLHSFLLAVAPLLTAALLYLPVAGLPAFVHDSGGTVIVDRHGETLTCLPGPQGAFVWKLSWRDIPDEARRVFLRVEDRRFYRHRGVDPLALGRAVLSNLLGGRTVSGASTVTMQLARMVHPHGGGLTGKAQEALTAIRLEARMGKREILGLYLNHLPFGYNTRGLGAAAVRYFDRPLGELSRAELLVLATIPRAPVRYDPFDAPEVLLERARVLAPGLGVSGEELSAAIRSCRRGKPPGEAPEFVRKVQEELAVSGWGGARTGHRGAQGARAGLRTETVRVVTTLDAGLQREIRRIVRDELGRLAPGAVAAASEGGAPALPVADAAVLVLGEDGEVLAWVGSPERSAFLDAVEVRRSSGSTLKPFLYALALERGYTAASLLPDLPVSFGVAESYRPENFDRKSRAVVRLRTALASSLNTPSVQLLSRVGLDEFLSVCRQLGFALPADAAPRYGLGAAVGNAEVTLAELTRAFGVFPHRGLLAPARILQGRVFADGSTAQVSGGTPLRVFREETAWLVTDILSDPAARTTGFGASSRFNSLPQAMFKSGTSSDYESLWCLGATASHTVGVWAGNLDGRPAFGTTGSSLPAQIALAAFEALASRGTAPTPVLEGWPRPAALREQRICLVSGRPATPWCPATRLEYLPAGADPAARTVRAAGPADSDTAWACPVHPAAGVGSDLEGLHAEGRPAEVRPVRERPRAESLLAELLAGPQGAPRILFPLPEQLFYRDRAVEAKAQRLEAWIVAPPGSALTLRLEGPGTGNPSPEVRLAYPFRAVLPLEPGTYRLEVVGADGVDSVRYYVR